jgi:HlyD family secretion protein
MEAKYLSRKTKIIIAIVAAAIILFAGVRFITGRRRTVNPTTGRVSAQVTRGDLDVRVSGTGTVEAGAREELRASFTSTVLKNYMVDSASVSAGQVLMELEADDISLQIERDQLDVQIQQRDLAKLQDEKTYVAVEAPHNGRLTWHVKGGDKVQSETLLATLVDSEQVDVIGRFEAASIQYIKVGQTAKFSLPEHNLDISGQVAEVGTVASPGVASTSPTTFYEVQAEIDNAGSLAIGSRGRMTVVTGSGSFQAAELVTLALPEIMEIKAPIAGKIGSLRFAEGAHVGNGATITEVTDSARQDQLNSSIRTAELKLRQLELELDDLLVNHPDNTLLIDQKQNEIEIQSELLDSLYNDSTYQSVTASAAGQLSWKVKSGDSVQEGAVIATVQNKSSLIITGDFTGSAIGAISKGQSVDFYLPDYGTHASGKVTIVGTSPKAGTTGTLTNMYDVRVTLKTPGSLDEGTTTGLLTVHSSAGSKNASGGVSVSFSKVSYLRASIAGIVKNPVSEHQHVRSGQIIAEINNSDRAEDLIDLIVTAKLKLQQSQLSLQDKMLQNNKLLNKALITAPFDGELVLESKLPGGGEEVSSGTLFGAVVDYSRMQVVIPVDELDVTQIKPGQTVLLTADALSGVMINGAVQSVASEGYTQGGVGVFDVTITIEPVENLRAGMSITADILVESRKQTLLVPIEAVQNQSGKSFLAVVDNSSGENGGFRLVEVETGAYNMTWIEIISGVKEGDPIMIPTGTTGQAGFGGGGMIGVGGMMGSRPTGDDAPRLPQRGN